MEEIAGYAAYEVAPVAEGTWVHYRCGSNKAIGHGSWTNFGDRSGGGIMACQALDAKFVWGGDHDADEACRLTWGLPPDRPLPL